MDNLTTDPGPRTDCPECGEQFMHVHAVCPNCNYPIQGSEEEKMLFGREQAFLKYDYSMAQDNIKRGQYVLIGVGAITVFQILVLWVDDALPTLELILSIGIAFLIFFLAYYTKHKPFLSLLIGFSLITSVYILEIIVSPDPMAALLNGIILKSVIVLALAFGTYKAYSAQQIIKRIASTKWMP